ncbi:MAG: Uncharacterised protein [Candidatus Nitrosopelagicus brevis]|nr:MAG: Uncharacterised protein [Candidatus Nitrosopelagicus brevis]
MVNFEIFELLSITTDVVFASKYSPDRVIVLKPDFDKLIAIFRDSTNTTFPKRKFLSDKNLLSHFT